MAMYSRPFHTIDPGTLRSVVNDPSKEAAITLALEIDPESPLTMMEDSLAYLRGVVQPPGHGRGLCVCEDELTEELLCALVGLRPYYFQKGTLTQRIIATTYWGVGAPSQVLLGSLELGVSIDLTRIVCGPLRSVLREDNVSRLFITSRGQLRTEMRGVSVSSPLQWADTIKEALAIPPPDIPEAAYLAWRASRDDHALSPVSYGFEERTVWVDPIIPEPSPWRTE